MRTQTETNPARLELMRKAAALFKDMDLDITDSQDYADLYNQISKIYIKYDP